MDGEPLALDDDAQEDRLARFVAEEAMRAREAAPRPIGAAARPVHWRLIGERVALAGHMFEPDADAVWGALSAGIQRAQALAAVADLLSLLGPAERRLVLLAALLAAREDPRTAETEAAAMLCEDVLDRLSAMPPRPDPGRVHRQIAEQARAFAEDAPLYQRKAMMAAIWASLSPEDRAGFMGLAARR